MQPGQPGRKPLACVECTKDHTKTEEFEQLAISFDPKNNTMIDWVDEKNHEKEKETETSDNVEVELDEAPDVLEPPTNEPVDGDQNKVKLDILRQSLNCLQDEYKVMKAIHETKEEESKKELDDARYIVSS